jgi:hypothetical protein
MAGSISFVLDLRHTKGFSRSIFMQYRREIVSGSDKLRQSLGYRQHPYSVGLRICQNIGWGIPGFAASAARGATQVFIQGANDAYPGSASVA